MCLPVYRIANITYSITVKILDSVRLVMLKFL